MLPPSRSRPSSHRHVQRRPRLRARHYCPTSRATGRPNTATPNTAGRHVSAVPASGHNKRPSSNAPNPNKDTKSHAGRTLTKAARARNKPPPPSVVRKRPRKAKPKPPFSPPFRPPPPPLLPFPGLARSADPVSPRPVAEHPRPDPAVVSAARSVRRLVAGRSAVDAAWQWHGSCAVNSERCRRCGVGWRGGLP